MNKLLSPTSQVQQSDMPTAGSSVQYHRCVLVRVCESADMGVLEYTQTYNTVW